MALSRGSRMLRRGIAPVAIAALVLAAGSAAREQVVSARAVVTGSGTTYRLTWTNTGDQAILCAGLLLTGVQPTSASGPTGVLTRVGTFQGRGLVHMQGSASVPAVPVGGTAVVNFTTNVPIPAGALKWLGARRARATAPALGEIRYSATCLPNSDVFGEAERQEPPPPQPPPLPRGKCECQSLEVSTRGITIGQSAWSMTMDWVLTCKGNNGLKCQGQIKDMGWVGNPQILVKRPTPPRAKKGQPPNPVTVTCRGKCGKRASKGSVRVSGSTKTPAFRTRVRASQGYTFSFRSWCESRPKNFRVYVKFDAKGRLDKKASDLNGNGTFDGQEKRR